MTIMRSAELSRGNAGAREIRQMSGIRLYAPIKANRSDPRSAPKTGIYHSQYQQRQPRICKNADIIKRHSATRAHRNWIKSPTRRRAPLQNLAEPHSSEPPPRANLCCPCIHRNRRICARQRLPVCYIWFRLRGEAAIWVRLREQKASSQEVAPSDFVSHPRSAARGLLWTRAGSGHARARTDAGTAPRRLAFCEGGERVGPVRER